MTKQEIKDKVRKEFEDYCKQIKNCEERICLDCRQIYYLDIIADLTIKLEEK